MNKEVFNRELVRSELLSQPVLRVILEEIQDEVDQNSILAEKLVWVGISGSKARQAGIRGKDGILSDDDLVMLLNGATKQDPLCMEAYECLLGSLNRATERLILEEGIIPVFASTIRLEDAQMAMAKLMDNNSGMKLQMVHSLIYSSPETALAFEPPLLIRGLFGQSLGLWGDDLAPKRVVEMLAEGVKIDNPSLTSGGLDGISDNFRMLVNNQHILPRLFLGPQVSHVLDYTFKWKMADIVNKRMRMECGTWNDVLNNFPTNNGGKDLINLINIVRRLRCQEDEINLSELEDVCRLAIGLWSVLVSFEQNEN
jgi:hypothetical protein